MAASTQSHSGTVCSSQVRTELDAAAAHLKAGRALKARRHCRNALQLEPDNIEALLLMVQGTLGRGRASEAHGYLNKALGVAPDNPRIRLLMAEYLVQQGQFEEARVEYERILTQLPDHEQALGGLAVALQSAGKVEEARAAYKRVIDVAPHDARIQHNYGTLLKQLHDFDGAVNAYRRAITLSPYDDSYRLRLGLALIEKGEFGEAVEHMDVLALQNPRHARCAYYQSYAHMKLGNGEAAVAAANRYLQIAGKSVSTLTSVASTSLTAGDAERALEACEEALALDPGSRHSLADYAIALSCTGRRQEALEIFDTSRLLHTQMLAAPAGYDSIAEFNQALVEHIRSHPSLDFDRISLSCHEGATSTELFVEPLGPAGPLSEMIRAAAQRYRSALGSDSAHPYLANLPQNLDALELSGWATILRDKGYQHGHIHGRSWVSGVYYVALPEVMSQADAGDQGAIEFGRAPYYYAKGDQGELKVITPVPGKLVLFPSYFFHRTIPFHAPQQRVTIAFDFLVDTS